MKCSSIPLYPGYCYIQPLYHNYKKKNNNNNKKIVLTTYKICHLLQLLHQFYLKIKTK